MTKAAPAQTSEVGRFRTDLLPLLALFALLTAGVTTTVVLFQQLSARGDEVIALVFVLLPWVLTIARYFLGGRALAIFGTILAIGMSYLGSIDFANDQDSLPLFILWAFASVALLNKHEPISMRSVVAQIAVVTAVTATVVGFTTVLLRNEAAVYSNGIVDDLSVVLWLLAAALVAGLLLLPVRRAAGVALAIVAGTPLLANLILEPALSGPEAEPGTYIVLASILCAFVGLATLLITEQGQEA